MADVTAVSLTFNENGTKAYCTYTQPSTAEASVYIDCGFVPTEVTSYVITLQQYKWMAGMTDAHYIDDDLGAGTLTEGTSAGFTPFGDAAAGSEETAAAGTILITPGVADADTELAVVTDLGAGCLLAADVNGGNSDVVYVVLER